VQVLIFPTQDPEARKAAGALLASLGNSPEHEARFAARMERERAELAATAHLSGVERLGALLALRGLS
jgi:hypothetical protein